jgi:glutathione S-transferase
MGTWGKVPVLEHNGQVKGESVDLLEYLDQEFGGPTIMPTVKLLYPCLLKLSFKNFFFFFLEAC